MQWFYIFSVVAIICLQNLSNTYVSAAAVPKASPDLVLAVDNLVCLVTNLQEFVLDQSVFSSYLIKIQTGDYVRALTSVLEANGKTLALGTIFTDPTAIADLNADKDFFGDVELADGKEHEGYYIPLATDGDVWGAVGAAEKAVAK